RIGALYTAMMDEKTIESQGVAPLWETLDEVSAIDSAAELMETTGKLQRKGIVGGPIGTGAMPDAGNPERVLLHMIQSGWVCLTSRIIVTKNSQKLLRPTVPISSSCSCYPSWRRPKSVHERWLSGSSIWKPRLRRNTGILSRCEMRSNATIFTPAMPSWTNSPRASTG